ncbi:MAG: hypothetical protein PWP37_834 [Thermotogota bacterium]|nr:hypothetical protein [Thermotogota bacterium]
MTFQENTLLVIYGPHASGKTALLRAIAGLDEAKNSNGIKVFLDGRSIDSILRKTGHSSVIYIDASMIDSIGIFKVKEATKALSRFNIRNLTEQAFDIIKLLNLQPLFDNPNKPLASFSSSQRASFLVLLALVKPSKIMIFDGIFDHLDDERLCGLVNILRDSISDKLVIISTRHERRFLHFADHFVALKDGKIVFEGDPRDYVMVSR